MLIDAFLIPRNNSTIAITLTATSANTPLPATSASAAGALGAGNPYGGGYLHLVNSGANTAFVETSPVNSGVVASVTTSFPVLPNTSKTIRIKDGDTVIAVIGSAAGGTLYVTPGVGT